MKVTTTTLQMLHAPAAPAGEFPDGVRLDRAGDVSPEYARFLYGLVGGPWFWTDRLSWTREQWAAELAAPGTEFWILYGEGVPLGYTHLQPLRQLDGTQVEIRYFGLAEQAIGRGLGRLLLEHAVRAAWTIDRRSDSGLPAVTRVWVHTCSLDGPAALANYQARGFVISDVTEDDEPKPGRPVGSWLSTGGAATRTTPTG